MSQKIIRFENFGLDYSRFQLSRNGRPVRLEGLPLQLLMFLVEKRGELVTREQIASALWSKDVFVDVEQGINTAVRKVRRALGTMLTSRGICKQWSAEAIGSLRPFHKKNRLRMSQSKNYRYPPKNWVAQS